MTAASDEKAFRTALGRFATGIAIVTAQNAQGEPIGLTVNSFNSVSLNPPLVLWSLANKNQDQLNAFIEASHFAVNILTREQKDLSNLFAYDSEKFAKVSYESGLGKAPIFPNALAIFQCENLKQYEGGDHTIFIGKVIDFTTNEGEPLLYFNGGYGAFTADNAG